MFAAFVVCACGAVQYEFSTHSIRIGDYKSTKGPVFFEGFVEQFFRGRTGIAIKRIIGAHDRTRFAFVEGCKKRAVVAHVKGAFAQANWVGVSAAGANVDYKMFGRTHHAGGF